MIYRECGQFKTTYAADQAMLPIRQDKIFVLAVVALAIALPFLVSDYVIQALLLPFLIYALAAIGLNILVGYCGQISLGTGGFMAVGAFAAWNILERMPDMPILVGFVLGALCASGAGVLFGLPALRIKGFYLAVTTLAAQFFLVWLLQRPFFVGYNPTGVISAQEIELLGWTVDSSIDKYLFALVTVVIMALVAKNLVRSATGRKWMAIRDMDVAAEIIGIRPMLTKLKAFAVSSFFVGLAGILWAYLYLGQLEANAFDIYTSFDVLFMVIIGGLGSILGSFLGAAFVVLVPILLNIVPGWLGLPLDTAMVSYIEVFTFGALIIFFLIVEPHGLARLWTIAKQKLRLWPFPY